jgi:hypothetical protein
LLIGLMSRVDSSTSRVDASDMLQPRWLERASTGPKTPVMRSVRRSEDASLAA